MSRIKTHEADESNTTADDRQPAPGQPAGPCAQCGRPLVRDHGGRVHDEHGEYLCTGPKTAESAVHVPASPASDSGPVDRAVAANLNALF